MIILGTNSIKDTGYDVANSLRFNSGSSDFLNRTTETPTNADKATFSFWVKRSKLGTNQSMLSERADGNNLTDIYFNSDDKLEIYSYNSGTEYIFLRTVRLFRDVGAWMHIMYSFDTSQGTNTNRVKLYINGVQETSFSSGSGNVYPNQNQNLRFNESGHTLRIGNLNSDQYPDFYLSEVVFVDGTAQANTDLGEFDEDSGIWKPKNVSGLTFGTNGFYLDFENSGSLGADVSGNSNNFTVNNLTAIDQSTDTCTNNFATINSLDKWSGSTAATSSFLSNGNLDLDIGSSAKSLVRSTIGVTSGKWYYEVKVNTKGKGFFGFCNTNAFDGSTSPHDATDSRGIFYYDQVPDFRGNSGDGAITTGVASISNGNILNFALDMDNFAFYIGVGGTYMNSGNPTSGSNKTGAISELFTNGSQYLSNFGEVFACLYCSSTSGGVDSSINFGSPPYSESGGNSDGNGYGNFNQSVPSGYYSLNTKNLSEYG